MLMVFILFTIIWGYIYIFFLNRSFRYGIEIIKGNQMNLKQIEPIEVEPNIFFLDSRLMDSFGVSGSYLVIGDGLTLIETGTALTAPYILDAIDRLGFKKEDIKRAIVTHIHLDHAGATGWLVKQLPDLKIYVHERGLKHLEDPSKLIESAKMVYGNLEAIIHMHGDIDPVPRENLIPVTDQKLDIGNHVILNMIDAPGHAGHHLCIFESKTGCLFSGEALGHYRPEFNSLQSAAAPPAFNMEATLETINKIRTLNPRTICFSQYGFCRDPLYVINEAIRQLHRYHDLLLPLFRRRLDMETIKKRVMDHLIETEDPSGNLSGSMLTSVITGYQMYFRRNGKID